MAISREIQGLLAKEQFAAIEDDWLAKSASSPDDLEYFVGVARALTGVSEDDRARFLLEMLDELYRQEGRFATRLKLIHRVGSILWPAPEDQHREIIAALRGLYGNTPSFDGFLQAVRLDKAPQDLPKTWEKVERLQTLVPFDVGAVVWMEGKGGGRVAEINLALESLKINFVKHPGLTVGFRAAAKLLMPLNEGHVLRRKMEDPAELARFVDQDPPAGLRLVLESYGRPLTAGEVRDALDSVISESRWTSWWGAARKHPQVVADNKGRQTYSWLASSEHATEAVWRRFASGTPREQLLLLKKEGVRDRDLAARMAGALADLAAGPAAQNDPGLAFEVWFALDRAGVPVPSDAPYTPERLLAHRADPGPALRGIEDRAAREKALSLTRELRPDWPQIFLGLLPREEDPRLLDILTDSLLPESSQELWRFIDAVIGQPHKTPAAFVWVLERASRDETFRERNALRLLEQLFVVLIDPRFTPLRPRLLPMVESGGTAPRVLAHISEKHAAAAAEAIQRAAGLESYQREALGNALHMRFPILRANKDEVIYSTPEAINERREELRKLLQEEIPTNRKAIEEARAMGDLRENFEYKSARQRHEYLSSRQAKLERELTIARPLDPSRIDTTEVRIGTRVSLRGAQGEQRVITLLGPWDSRPEEDILAYESELAQGLLGKRVGDQVSINKTPYEVLAIETWR